MRSSTSTRSSADQGSRRRTASVRIRTPAGPALNRGRSSRSAPVSAASPTAATAASSRPAGSAMRTSRTATTAPAAAVAVATGRGDQEWLCGPGRVVRSAVGASSDAGSIPASVRSPCGYRGVTMREAVIVEAVRTPVGRRRGALSEVHPVDLSAHVLGALADRTGLDPAVVDDVVWGCVSQVGEQAINVGRNAVLAAGWPESVPGTTVDRQCGSSQQTVHFAAAAVASGQADIVVACAAQIVPVSGVSADEGVRRDTSMENLAGLKTPFKADGVVTAGNASQISDGAAALLVMTSERAAELGLRPIARIHTAVMAAADPVIMLTAPIPATEKALKRSGLAIGDLGAYEVNEAFASVPLAWLAEMGADPARLNPNGGAIALGHPLGGSGARLMTTLVHHLRDRGLRYGLQTMCEGGGMANATILENLT